MTGLIAIRGAERAPAAVGGTYTQPGRLLTICIARIALEYAYVRYIERNIYELHLALCAVTRVALPS